MNRRVTTKQWSGGFIKLLYLTPAGTARHMHIPGLELGAWAAEEGELR